MSNKGVNKFLVHLIAILGLILSLGYLLNWYEDHDRTDFYQTIDKHHNCPVDHPGAKKFLKEYFYNQNPTKEEQNKEFKEIRLTGIFSNGNLFQTYSVIVKARDGFAKRLSSLEELKNWSSSPPKFWQWIGWIVVSIGVLAEITISILDKKRPKTGTQKQRSDLSRH